MYKLKLKNFFIVTFLISTANIFAALPENISDLVDESAPAVVNITAKKEVSQRSSYGYGAVSYTHLTLPTKA